MEGFYRKESKARKSLAKEKLKFTREKQEFRVTTASHWLSCVTFHWLGLLLSKKKIFFLLPR